MMSFLGCHNFLLHKNNKKKNVESLKREERRHDNLNKLRKSQIQDIFTVSGSKKNRVFV